MSVEVIAEAGSNHNGDVSKAILLSDIAKSAGASSIKFQFIFADGLYVPEYISDENKKAIPSDVYRRRKEEELSEDHWIEVWQHARSMGLDISASVFCSQGLDLLTRLGASYVKIASTDSTNTELISAALDRFDRVIVSTGMTTLAELATTLDKLGDLSLKKGALHLLHCVSVYPCPIEISNPERISLLREISGLPVGYSDHTEGVEAAILALSKGAKTFEKHFTFDRSAAGFDHMNAATPDQLCQYIKTLSSCSKALASTDKALHSKEMETRIRARRGLYAGRDLLPGEKICREDLLFVRPSTADQVIFPEDFIGRTVGSKIVKHAPISQAETLSEGSSNWRSASAYWSQEMLIKKIAPTK